MEEKETCIDWTNSATSTGVTEQIKSTANTWTGWPSLDRRSRSVWPFHREDWETPILLSHYRKGHTPTRPLCLISRSKTRWSRTTPRFAGLWCQSCLASTFHSCIASARLSVETSDYEGAPITTNCCPSISFQADSATLPSRWTCIRMTVSRNLTAATNTPLMSSSMTISI